MKASNYLFFLVSLLGVLLIIELVRSNNKNVATTSLALEPVIHLVNTKLYLEEDHAERSKSELAAAIRKTYLLKDKLDHKESLNILGQTLPDLVKLHGQIGADEEFNDQLTQSSVKTLLALAYVQIRHAKSASVINHPHEMKTAIKKSMYIIKKSLLLSEGSKKDYEVDIYAKLSDLLDQKYDQTKANAELDEIMEEINDLEVSFDRDLQVHL